MTMPAEAAFGESTMAIPYKEFEFTFDSLLDTSLKIEVDVSFRSLMATQS